MTNALQNEKYQITRASIRDFMWPACGNRIRTTRFQDKFFIWIP